MNNSRKYICVVRHQYYPGDPRLLKQINALIGNGYSVDLLCLRKKGQKLIVKSKDLNIYRIPIFHSRSGILRYISEYGSSFILMGLFLMVLYFRRKYKVIQVHTMPDFLVFITLIPKLFGTKIVLDLHEPMPELWLTKFGNNRFHWFVAIQIRMEQLAIRYSNLVITVNETIKNRFVQRGALAYKIIISHNVPDDTFIPAAVPPNHNEDFIIILHGSIEHRYGHELLINTIPYLKENLDAFKIHIVGDGSYRQELEKLIYQNGYSDKVLISGWLPLDQVPQYIVSADVGIVPLMPTPFSELCQPNKLFEIVAFKKPVIAARLTAIEEIFDENSIKYFKPGNVEDLARCIIELYKNPEEREILSTRAWNRYQEFKWSSTKKVFLKAITGLTE